MISRIATSLVGLILLVYGVIAALSPFLPAGAPLAILGALMIAFANPALRPIVKRMRTRWSWFDRLVTLVAHRTPERMKVVIEETAPEDSADAKES